MKQVFDICGGWYRVEMGEDGRPFGDPVLPVRIFGVSGTISHGRTAWSEPPPPGSDFVEVVRLDLARDTDVRLMARLFGFHCGYPQ